MALRQVPRHSSLPSKAESRRNTAETTTVAQSPGTWSWSQISDWISGGEHPITDDRHDLFGRAPVANRIARTLQEGRSVALLGAYGTGKSSVLNLVREKSAQGATTTIIANFDVWAVPRCEDVPRLALEQVVDALDHHVDTLGLRNIPVTYQRLVAALPTRNVSTILKLHTEGDSLAELHRLVPVLEVLNARLVLFVEDVERLPEEFDTRHLQRLLWAFGAVPRVSFVLAYAPCTGPNIDYSKLCDTMELLRPMEYEHVGEILETAINRWRSAYPDIDPRPHWHRSTLRLESHRAGGMHEYLRRIAPDTPLHHLVRLLQTPRRLRQVLRRVDLIWRNLHGEADLEDITILTALREAATPVYEFLLTHIDVARQRPDGTLPPVANLTNRWNDLTASPSYGPAARQLVHLLGIEQLSDGGGRYSQQRVHWAHPVDYFRRIAAGQLDPEELRDQTVLKDIDSWRQRRAGSLVDRLVAANADSDRYAVVWLHFSERHVTSELTELTSGVVERVLSRDGAQATANHPALVALSHTCNRRLQQDQEVEWVRTLILKALTVSLGFATEFYDTWTGENGIVSTDARQQIRAALIDAAQRTLRNGADLAALLSPTNSYGVCQFVFCMASDQGGAALETWREHLAPALVTAARTHPEVILPELANLLGDEESSMRAPDSDPPTFVGRYAIDRERAQAVLGDTLDDVLESIAEYNGASVYVVRAKEAAGIWLRARRGEST